MSSKTKIVVLRMKEIIYTAIFVGLAILLITLCFIMFRPGKDNVSVSAEPGRLPAGRIQRGTDPWQRRCECKGKLWIRTASPPLIWFP